MYLSPYRPTFLLLKAITTGTLDTRVKPTTLEAASN